MTTTKWYYPVQEKMKSYLLEIFDQYQCDWQDVVEHEGIVYERYSGVTNSGDFLAVLITITKQANDFFVYRLIENKFEVTKKQKQS